jgi:hypothetical protein
MMNFTPLVGLMALFVGQADGLVLRGTVVDSDGKPVANARVDISTAAPRVGPQLFCPSCYRDCKKSTRTDKQGKFEIGGLDAKLKFSVLASAIKKKAQMTKLIDPLGGEVTIALESLQDNLPESRLVQIQVVNDRGQPISGALVEPVGGKTSKRRWGGLTKGVDPAVSDAQGRINLPLPEDFLAVDVNVIAQGYAGALGSQLAPGPKQHKLVIPSGTRITGRLVHNGMPVSGISIAVVQVDRSANHLFIKAVGDVTNSEGKFTFDQLPANEDYAIFTLVGDGPQKQVISTKRFKAASDRQQRDLGDLQLISPLRIAGRVELLPGQSIPPNAKLTISRNPAWDLIAIPIATDGSFVVEGLPPETYTLRLAVKGIEIDGSRMPYQMLDSESFGLRLKETIGELRIAQSPKP